MSRVGLVYLRGSAEERALVRNVYVRLELEGTARRVFMDGTVTSAEAFEADTVPSRLASVSGFV